MNLNQVKRLVVGEKLQGQDKMRQEMCILFALLHGSNRIANGSFIVTPEQGTSCFGNFQEVEVVLDKNHTTKTGLFEGVIFDHKLENDSASISLRLFEIVENKESPFGMKQIVKLKSGLAMGKYSGSDKHDSVALGPDYVLLFRTALFPK